jgi:hypothetical protein
MIDQASWLAIQNGSPIGSNTIATTRCTCTGRDLCAIPIPTPACSYHSTTPGFGSLSRTRHCTQATPIRNTRPRPVSRPSECRICCACLAKPNSALARPPGMPSGSYTSLPTGSLWRSGAHDRDREGALPLQGDILNSTAVASAFSKNGTYFLAQAFPEGSPQHPSDPQGHATMTGACATILKSTAVSNSTPLAMAPSLRRARTGRR